MMAESSSWLSGRLTSRLTSRLRSRFSRRTRCRLVGWDEQSAELMVVWSVDSSKRSRSASRT